MTQPKYKMNRSPNEDEHWCRIYTKPFSFADQKIPALTSWKGGYGKNGLKNPSGCTSKQNAYSKAFNNLLNQLSGIMKIRTSINGSWEAIQGQGSNHLFCNGYELHLRDFDALEYAEESALYNLPFDTANRLTTTNVMRQSPEIFNWLGMLDINVVLIIGLMILISIINMVSALLITILEKRADVGLLKALGLRDSKVIMTFVNYSARIILVGFIIGNMIGFGVCFIQTSTGLITLDPAAYYISEVPIKIDIANILTIEIIAFACCVVSMFLPALYSTRIQPSTALRINE